MLALGPRRCALTTEWFIIRTTIPLILSSQSKPFLRHDDTITNSSYVCRILWVIPCTTGLTIDVFVHSSHGGGVFRLVELYFVGLLS